MGLTLIGNDNVYVVRRRQNIAQTANDFWTKPRGSSCKSAYRPIYTQFIARKCAQWHSL